MLAPKSGIYGYMKIGQVEIPIYSWSLQKEQIRPTYRTSNSALFPKRTKGLHASKLSVTTVDVETPFVFGFANALSIGWLDFTINKRKEITFTGMLTEEVLIIDYTSTTSPAFTVTSSFIGITSAPVIATVNLIPLEDVVLCGPRICSWHITTSDLAIAGGLLQYIKKATITNTAEVSQYYRSNSNKCIVNNKGVRDCTIVLEVEGGLDYWLVRAGGDNLFDYTFYYGVGAIDYWVFLDMKVLSVTNLIVNIQTGEMISATVTLGASYG